MAGRLCQEIDLSPGRLGKYVFIVSGFQISEAIIELLQENNPAPLGKGPRKARAEETRIESCMGKWDQEGSLESEKAQLIKAVLLLWHDYLDECHVICQDVKSASGSLIHAMMHRREGDFSNAKYWYARAGRHPVYSKYEEFFQRESNSKFMPVDLRKAMGERWNPAMITEQIEKVATKTETPLYKELQNLQYFETLLLVQFLAKSNE